MEKIKYASFNQFIKILDVKLRIDDGDSSFWWKVKLFRGQPGKFELLPSVARKDPEMDTQFYERRALEELKRRSKTDSRIETNDWDWLVLAQHYGLKTRLLDFTTNPLVALWFACSNDAFSKKSSYCYIFDTEDTTEYDDPNISPFEIEDVTLVKPKLNNDRVVAQDGWFTAHPYSEFFGKFVPLEYHDYYSDYLTEVEIPANKKQLLLETLSSLGVSARTIYPDITGLCQYLNWYNQL